MTDVASRRRDVIMAGHQRDIATITAALTDTTPAVRAAAVGAGVRAGCLTTDHIARALADDDAEVRRRALGAAQSLGDPTPVVPLLDDTDAVVAETAAFVLGELEPRPDVVEAVVRTATSHPEHLVREAAVAALGALGDPAGLPAVIAAMDERATIRRRAVLALAAFDDPSADAAIAAALEDRDRQVRQAAEDLQG